MFLTEVLRMVAARHPEVPPLTTVLRWLRELAATPVTGDGEVSNALGLALDEEQLDVLGYVLEDLPFEQLLERLGDEYRPRDVAAAKPQLLRLNEAVREAPAVADSVSRVKRGVVRRRTVRPMRREGPPACAYTPPVTRLTS